MLWRRKRKVHDPFGNDFNLKTIRLPDPYGPRTPMSYTFPDNWYCQLIGATLYSKAGAFGQNQPYITVARRGRWVWLLPYDSILVSNLAQDICWGVNLPLSAVNSTRPFVTAPLPEHCFIEAGDTLTMNWLAKSIDDVQKTGTIYLKQWIIY